MKPATPEEENNPPPGFRVQYEKDPIAGTVGYLVPDDSDMDGGMSVSPALPSVSGPRMSAAGGRKPYDLSMSLRAPEYTDAVAAMKATAGRSMPRFPVDEGDDLEEEDVGQGPMVQPTPAARPAPAAPQSQPSEALAIPPDLLERLRAARRRDAADAESSSLGRLLMATSAGFSGVPTAPALMQDYMAIEKERRGAGRREFGEEQDLLASEAQRQKEIAQAKKQIADAESKKREDSLLDDPNSPAAKLYQSLAARMGIPPEIASRLTERSGKGLLEVFKVDEGGRLRAALQDTKQQQAMDIQKMREELAIKLEQMRSGDRQAAIDAQMLIAALKQQGESAAGIRAKVDQQRLDFQIDKEADARVERLNKNIPRGLEASYENARYLIGRIYNPDGSKRKDIPAVGSFEGGLPGFLMTEEGQRIRKAFDLIKNEYGHEKFGSALNAGEQERLDRALSSIKFLKTEDDFRFAVEEINHLLGKGLSKVYRGFDDQTIREHFARGGLPVIGDERHGLKSKLYREGRAKRAAIAANDALPQGSATKSKVMMTNGQEFREVDASDVDEAKKDGYRVVPSGGK